jgi:polysaccharide biosynthesis protein PslH
MQQYEQWAQQRANYVWCVTDDDSNYFKQQGTTTMLLTRPYGTYATASPIDKEASKQHLCQQWQIPSNHLLIFYNGTLGYKPNSIGLDVILQQVNPILQQSNLPYSIIICGSQLPAHYNNLQGHANIIYKGFVDDIAMVYQGVDIFLNPVVGGGGVKTKLVDALAYGLTAISSVDGAVGINTNVVHDKLITVPDFDGQAMANKILELAAKPHEYNKASPAAFYNYYNWHNSAQRLIEQMQ